MLSNNPWEDNKEEKSVEKVTKFEDNFAEINNDNPNEKLPDSSEYLERLESKLRKLKKDTNLLSHLSARREQCMDSLLKNEINLKNHLELDEPIAANNQLLFRLNPEQPLIVGEVVHLVEHDELDSFTNNQEAAEQQESPSR